MCNHIGFLKKLLPIFQSLWVGLVLFLVLNPTPGFPNPQGAEIAAGAVNISTPDANTMQINQSSDKAIINWQTFNISESEKVHFQQPDASSITLNRIDPNNGTSKIMGSVSANGQIWLVNPAGIWFGPSARVDVAGLIATTANISNQDFLSGHYHFIQSPEWRGSIVNEGEIIIRDAGLAALVGTGVINNGRIVARLGTVVLGASREFTVDFSGDQLIQFAVGGEVTQPGLDAEGHPLRDAIKNSGEIIANGGKIAMHAHTAREILDHSINMQGVAQAQSVSVKNGEIILMAGEGRVNVSGKIDASGKNSGEKGGKVVISSKEVALQSVKIDVSGDKGGGDILIGGDYQGKNLAIQNAKQTFVGPDANLYADALTSGNGGKVIVWGDNDTYFYGNIYARGGAQNGHGGLVETSGKNYLDVMGNVNASAANGQPGSWLLDPRNVTISSSATTCTTPPCFSGGNPDTYTPDTNASNVNNGTINSALNGGTSVTITTGTTGTQAGNITLNSGVGNEILKSAGGAATLTLNAANNITLNNTIISTVGALDIALISGNAITINNALSTNGGNIDLTSGNGITINDALTATGGNFSSTSQNATTLASAIDTGAGKLNINVNQDGAGTQNFVMNSGGSLTTTSTAADAVQITVNTSTGGSGTAALRDITTGSGGTISVVTNPGTNTTGGDITMPSGILNVDTGTITLTTSQTAGRNIGTSLANVNMIAGTLNATTGNGGIFVTNTGTSAFDLGSINTTGGLTLTSTASSAITDSGTLSVTGTATLAAGATHDITLNSPANNFGTVTITSGKNVSLLDTTALALGASIISGAYDVTAGGSITQSGGALSVEQTPTFTVTAASSDISLASFDNDFAVTPVITDNGKIRDLLLKNINASAQAPTLPTSLPVLRDVTLNFPNASALVLPTANISRSLSVIANGPITQSGSSTLTVPTTATFVAGSANDITINNAGNNFGTVVITSGKNVSILDTNALVLGASNVSGFLDVTSGALTDSGALVVAGVISLATGTSNIVLNNANNNFSTVAIANANNVTLVDTNALNFGLSTIGGTLSATANGAITQSDSMTVSGTATFSVGAANNIILNNAANNFNTARFTTANDVTITNADALVLGASNVSGSLNVITGGALTDSGNLTVNDTLFISAINGVVLNSGNNQIANLNVTNTGGGNITITNDHSPFTITGFSQSSGGTVTFNQAGTLSIADGVTINSNNANLTITATDLNLNASGALNSGTANTTITQNTAGGSIGLGNATGTMTISGSEFERITANNLTITAPNNGQINVDGITATNSANILGTTTLTATTGTLGSINFQNESSAFRALTANADNGININTNVVATAGNMILNADVNTAAANNDALTLGGNLTAAGSITLSALTGGIILTAPSSLTANGITINHALDGAFNLIVDSGTNSTLFQSTIGATTPIGSGIGLALTILSSGTTTLNNLLNTNSGIVGNGPINFSHSVNLGNGDSGSIFNGLVTLSNASGLSFSAFDGLAFNGGLTAENGAISINSNSSDISFGRTSSDQVTLNSPLAVTASDHAIVFNAAVNGPANLTLDAGSFGDITFNASLGGTTRVGELSIPNLRNLTSNSTINVSTFLLGGSGTAIFNNEGLQVAGHAQIAANRLQGNLNVGSLTINLSSGEFFGTVNNRSGVDAIRLFTVLNPIVPYRIFFNGIDIAFILTPSASFAPLETVLPTTFTSADASWYGLKMTKQQQMFAEMMSGTDRFYMLKVSSSCMEVSPDITICGVW